ncbi:MAG: adenylate/guanylate cyclase domain-containing protein, partial [Alphaproteobacteria bacterium]|nr:adenylate/guanylate cyclase domain-containing protein [Alphaproteobacteria bacterium]
MADQSVERRLAAIVATDMVAYGRLIEADEEGTLARQKAHRQGLIDPNIATHHGRIVKSTGDGLLIEFASPVDAVRCCVQVQRAIKELEAEVAEDRRIRYRVGINLGDIVIDGDDIYGDGVNIAARLEQLAEPGGVCVSGTVYDHLKAQVDVGYADLGPQQLKNIEKPVRAYRVLLEPEATGQVTGARPRRSRGRQLGAIAAAVLVVIALAVTALWWRPWAPDVEPARAERMALPLPDKPSIVVLPFVNLSGDPEQEYIVDGLTETIISQLSKSPRLFVIAKNSAFTYKNKPVKVHQVSEELGVRYVLEGSFQRSEKQVRVQARLIDATTGHHIWSEKYDRAAAGDFTIQDDIALNIAVTLGTVEGQIQLAELSRTLSKGSKNLQAWDHLQRCLGYYFKFDKKSNLLAREEALQALQLEPESAVAHAYVDWTHLAEVWLGVTKTPEKSYARGEEWARKAIAIDEKEYQGHYVLAFVHMAARRFPEAGNEFEKILDLNPNDAAVLSSYGMRYLVPVGRAEEGL